MLNYQCFAVAFHSKCRHWPKAVIMQVPVSIWCLHLYFSYVTLQLQPVFEDKDTLHSCNPFRYNVYHMSTYSSVLRLEKGFKYFKNFFMGSVVIQECEEGIFCLRMKGLRMKGVDTHVIYAKFQLFAVCRRNLSQKNCQFPHVFSRWNVCCLFILYTLLVALAKKNVINWYKWQKGKAHC